jgi:hypothetical protein
MARRSESLTFDAGMFGPVKRSEALAPLSRDHHQGLFVAMQLKRAAPDTREAARAAFIEFFEIEGGRHFRAEEELLLPAFARHGDPTIRRWCGFLLSTSICAGARRI